MTGPHVVEIDVDMLRDRYEARARASDFGETILAAGVIDQAIEDALTWGGNPSLYRRALNGLLRNDLEEMEEALREIRRIIGEEYERHRHSDRDYAEQVSTYLAKVCWAVANQAATRSPADAAALFEEALRADREGIGELRFQAARTFLCTGRTADADRAWREFLSLDPAPDHILDAVRDLVGLHEHLGSAEAGYALCRDAIEALRKLVRRNSRDRSLRVALVDAHRILADSLERADDYAASVPVRRDAVAIVADIRARLDDDAILRTLHGVSLSALGFALRELENWAEALPVYREMEAVVDGATGGRLLELMGMAQDGIGDLQDTLGDADARDAAWERARIIFQSLVHGGSDQGRRSTRAEGVSALLAEVIAKQNEVRGA